MKQFHFSKTKAVKQTSYGITSFRMWHCLLKLPVLLIILFTGACCSAKKPQNLEPEEGSGASEASGGSKRWFDLWPHYHNHEHHFEHHPYHLRHEDFSEDQTGERFEIHDEPAVHHEEYVHNEPHYHEHHMHHEPHFYHHDDHHEHYFHEPHYHHDDYHIHSHHMQPHLGDFHEDYSGEHYYANGGHEDHHEGGLHGEEDMDIGGGYFQVG